MNTATNSTEATATEAAKIAELKAKKAQLDAELKQAEQDLKANTPKQKPGRKPIHDQSPEAKRERNRLNAAKCRAANPEKYGCQTVRLAKTEFNTIIAAKAEEKAKELVGQPIVDTGAKLVSKINGMILQYETEAATMVGDSKRNFTRATLIKNAEMLKSILAD